MGDSFLDEGPGCLSGQELAEDSRGPQESQQSQADHEQARSAQAYQA